MEQTLTETTVEHRDMANALRFLAVDAVEKAKSGHPGMPMGMADVATVLFRRFLKYDPAHPAWPDRDRFVLSGGHGSMLLYGLLHLTGYEGMPLEALTRFRQLGSVAAGHPEADTAHGIETTTGPLGQGVANAVGMALAERVLNARFGDALVDHRTWVTCGDGDLMEGVSHEALSLAGHLRLSRLTVLYDDNHISIDGSTDLSFSEDVLGRLAACGWAVDRVDGHDPEAIARAMEASLRSDRPTLIACRTVIGYGAPTKANTAAAHGAPLGEAEVQATRRALGWTHAPFEIPDAIRQAWRQAGRRSASAYQAWSERHGKDPRQAAFDAALAGDLPQLDKIIDDLKREAATQRPKLATRAASGQVLKSIGPAFPQLLGGSADLTPSNNTLFPGAGEMVPGPYDGRYIHYGVREHGMNAIMNGIARHGGLIPYAGTFFCFADYGRAAIRLSALMGAQVIYVMTHDSIGLGEDGPTHQPVEHLAALRCMPNLLVMRPADLAETAECWQIALESRDAPSVLALSRQNLPTLRTEPVAENLSARGGYRLTEAAAGPQRVTLIASGSEVSIADEARKQLEAKGIGTALVSMPSHTLFDRQPEAYRRSVLGQGTLRVGVEAAVRFGWDRYLGDDGIFIGMEGFGLSGQGPALYEHFGITAEAIVNAVVTRLGA
jgi:transketolase